MKNVLSKINSLIWPEGIIYLALAILWELTTAGISHFENGRSYFELNPVLRFKLILSAVVYLGRYLIFSRYKLLSVNPWLYPVSLLLTSITVLDKLVGCEELRYGLLLLMDILVWTFFIKEAFDTIYALFHFWVVFPKINYAVINEIWGKLTADLMKLGLWLFLLTGLAFYYLVCFFLVDAVLYSYLFLIPLLLPGISLYILFNVKINTWIRKDLQEINGELASYFNWRQLKDEPDLAQRTAWFQYLTLLRNYLKDLQKPALLLNPLWLHLIYSILMLSLPYFWGIVVEV